MRNLIIFCLLLLVSSLAYSANVSYRYVPGLSSFSASCVITDKWGSHGSILDASGQSFHGAYSLDEAISYVNEYINDPFYTDISFSVSLYCHNGAHVNYSFHNDVLRGEEPVKMEPPAGCQ